MESKNTLKDYVITMPGARLLATDNKEKADKKIAELIEQKLGSFTFNDHVAGESTLYEKDQYQQNYRTTTTQLPEGDES